MLVSCACDWGRPSRNWPCAWTPSDSYRFLLSVSRNTFLSTDLQSAFLAVLGKEPSRGFQIHLTNLHALLNDQKAGSRNGSTSHQLAFRLPSTVTPPLRTDWGRYFQDCSPYMQSVDCAMETRTSPPLPREPLCSMANSFGTL